MDDFGNRFETMLPHQTDTTFLMDGGLETTLIFHDGLDLPYFASFPLLDTSEGRQTLRKYFEAYLNIARDHDTGFILETPTWRASPDWAALLGYNKVALDKVNRDAVAFLQDIVASPEYAGVPVILSGCIGPRGDGYVAGVAMTVEEARDYHSAQVASLANGGVQMVTALTMTYPEEAAGIALAAQDAGVAAAISFTVETDGRLPSGQALGEAIRFVDRVTDAAPVYFMVNCAHPTHFRHVLEDDSDWLARIHGVRANASKMSHAELDEAEELDAGNPAEFGAEHAELRTLLPNLKVIGGCCGTDHRHVGAVAHHICG